MFRLGGIYAALNAMISIKSMWLILKFKTSSLYILVKSCSFKQTAPSRLCIHLFQKCRSIP